MCRVMKLLSEDPANYKDAPREGIRRVLEEVTGKKHPRDQPLDTSRIASIRMGTTVSKYSRNSGKTASKQLLLSHMLQVGLFASSRQYLT